MPRLVVIGAGPIGLEAALLGRARGHQVTVLERDRVGAAPLDWGRARLFSPLGMNVSGRVRDALGPQLPDDDAILTGPELVESVLEPLARGPLAGCVREGCEVVAVGRSRLARLDRAFHPLRAERPFRVLCATAGGEEELEADLVIDASGTQSRPAPLGLGGPALGERDCARELLRSLGALERALPGLDGREVLLVGHGHSAATALQWLEAAGARVVWATRSANRRPCLEVAADPLPERQALTARANDLAANPPAFLRVERRAHVEAIERGAAGFQVRLSGGRGGSFAAVAAFTGHRPDLSFLSELQLEISPASEGPARLYRAISGVTDCLTPPRITAADLSTGESGFHFAGAKSYGRVPAFLLRSGLLQLEAMLG